LSCEGRFGRRASRETILKERCSGMAPRFAPRILICEAARTQSERSISNVGREFAAIK
jgi:hypothetical protein